MKLDESTGHMVGNCSILQIDYTASPTANRVGYYIPREAHPEDSGPDDAVEPHEPFRCITVRDVFSVHYLPFDTSNPLAIYIVETVRSEFAGALPSGYSLGGFGWTTVVASAHFDHGPNGEQVPVGRNDYVVEHQPGFEVKYGVGLGDIYYRSGC